MRALRGWAAITDTLYIWHYTVNFSHFPMPMPDLDEPPFHTLPYDELMTRLDS